VNTPVSRSISVESLKSERRIRVEGCGRGEEERSLAISVWLKLIEGALRNIRLLNFLRIALSFDDGARTVLLIAWMGCVCDTTKSGTTRKKMERETFMRINPI